jgi:short-subunit dehydrogenase
VLELGLSVDILVNNAGVGMCGPFAQAEEHDITKMLNLNITSLTQLTRLCLGPMLERGYGRILNVASTAAFQPGPFMSVYYASKAYVLHFSEGLATELAGSGVSVTALCPGPTRTEFQEVAGMSQARLNKMPFFQTATQVAQLGYKALMQGKVVAISGRVNWWMALSIRFFPRAIVRRLVAHLNKELS